MRILKFTLYFFILSFIILFSIKLYSFFENFQINNSKNPYKIYVALGFHTSMRHSWRGDAPDETGVGVDIRVVRKIIEILDEANKNKSSVCGVWDFESRWTIEEYVKKYAPDIIENIKRRVKAGIDEVVISPYNNGLVSASDEKEFIESIKRQFTNDKKSGLVDIFGKVTPLVRPQEMVFTPGHVSLYKKLGIKYISLYYSSTPFNSISNFIPVLSTEKRYNPIYLKDSTSNDKIILIPTYHHGDILENYSLKKWLLKLRKEQINGKVKNDLLIYINIDADSETWIGLDLPKFLHFIPNSSGLYEYIKTVDELKFAEWTTIGNYVKNHSPVGEITITQDLADGGYDGYFSWAEKLDTHKIWKNVEKSRYYTLQAEYLLNNEIKDDIFRKKIRETILGEENSSFIKRFETLSTTHFGMSNPVINNERIKQAIYLSGSAKDIAYQSLKECKKVIAREQKNICKDDCIYSFYLFNFKNNRSDIFVKVPIVLPENINLQDIKLTDEKNKDISFSIIDIEKNKSMTFANILFFPEIEGKSKRLFFVKKGNQKNDTINLSSLTLKEISNPLVKLKIDNSGFITSFKYKDIEFAKEKFIFPFVNYDNKILYPKKFEVISLQEFTSTNIHRIKLRGKIEINVENKIYPVELEYTFTIAENLPYLFADVKVKFPKTPTEKMQYTVVQKINRKLDLRWKEVAPFQIQPKIFSEKNNFLNVWKINYLGVVSSYKLDYKKINPKNANLSSFNNHITAPWCAISNGKAGLLISQNAQILSNFAFCPMRLKEINGIQNIFLNPYGTYYGKQFDYSHLGGNGVGVELINVIAPFLKSPAPSYNGGELNFSVLIAPYHGNKPPDFIRNDAMEFFYPCGIIYLKTPYKDIIGIEDIENLFGIEERFYVDEVPPQKIKKISPLLEAKNIPFKLILKLLWCEMIAILRT